MAAFTARYSRLLVKAHQKVRILKVYLCSKFYLIAEQGKDIGKTAFEQHGTPNIHLRNVHSLVGKK